MSYREALEAAGATVLAFGEFGSYQGDWLARLDTGKYAGGTYGSCSGCDAFEGEFGWNAEWCDEHYGGYNKPPEGCAACVEKKADYGARLAAFGKSYLDAAEDYTTIIARFAEQSEWDYDAKEVVAWLIEQEAKR